MATYFTTDIIQHAYHNLSAHFSGTNSANKLVTYYQWTSDDGEVVISRIKPTANQKYISFQATSDLVKAENTVDQELLNSSNEYKAAVIQSGTTGNTNKTGSSNKTGSQGSASSFYPIQALRKAKICTKLSSQIAEANRNGKDISTLKAQYTKEC